MFASGKGHILVPLPFWPLPQAVLLNCIRPLVLMFKLLYWVAPKVKLKPIGIAPVRESSRLGSVEPQPE
jgi:hypothetical protein